MRDLVSGDVRVTYTDNEKSISEIEMLLLPTGKITLTIGEDSNINMTIVDTELETSQISGDLSYETLDLFVKQLIKMRNQIKE